MYSGIYSIIIIFALFLVLLGRICVVFCVQLAVVVLVFVSRVKDK